MLGIADAEHAEYDPTAPTLVVAQLSCAVSSYKAGGPRLSGKNRIMLQPGSAVFRIYEKREIEEEFNCSYGLNPVFENALVAGGLQITGRDQTGEVRIVELPRHPFFVATLFLPQLSSSEGRPHPLVVAYVEAALGESSAP